LLVKEVLHANQHYRRIDAQSRRIFEKIL